MIIDKTTYDAARLCDAVTTFAALATMYGPETRAMTRAHLADQRDRVFSEPDVQAFYDAAIALLDAQEETEGVTR